MLSAIQRATLARPTAKNVCKFCQRKPSTTPINLGLSRHFGTALNLNISESPRVSKGFLRERSEEPPADLINETRLELEAHRQGLQKQYKVKEWENKQGEPKKKAKEPKKKDVPKAPKVRTSTAKYMGMPISHTGKSLADALRTGKKVLTLDSSTAELRPIQVPNQPAVPALSHDLDRVLFNPGVYFLQDPRSKVYNFDPYLQKLMPVHEFQFDALSKYITSSRDSKLEQVAKDLRKKYVGSTSSMTSVLSHFHYLLSSWRPINPAVVSQHFVSPWRTFTQLQRGPQSIFLRWKDGVYAIDADKEFDKESVLTLLGKSMEKLLTLPPEKFEKYRKSDNPGLAAEQGPAVDTYHYSTLGDFLMRSQLDAYDPRLPGTGMFDLKTRAVVSVRMDVENFHIGSGYQIKDRFGEWESFEREYFDMIRAAFLKYSLQVRMGRMDGIFVAFHNTERIFGFQYISLEEMDAAIHQDWHSGIGDREFKLSLQLLNDIFNRATARFPEKSLRIHFETRETQTPLMYIFIEPMEEVDIEKIQSTRTDDLAGFLKELGDRKQQYLRSLAEKEAELEAKLRDDEEFTVSETAAQQETEATSGEIGIIGKASTQEASSEEGEAAAGEEISKSEEPATDEITPANSEDEAPDEAWADQMAKELEADSDKPLLAFQLQTKSYVNGKVVLRPDHLKPSDTWEVQYELGEIKGNSAWNFYRACYGRRMNLERAHIELTGGIQAPEVAAGMKASDIRNNLYIETLRDISKRGREYITEVERAAGNAEKIVWKGKA